MLVWAGAGLLGWTAGEVIATDFAIQYYLVARFDPATIRQVVLSSSAVCTAIVLITGGLWRHVRRATEGKQACESSGQVKSNE